MPLQLIFEPDPLTGKPRLTEVGEEWIEELIVEKELSTFFKQYPELIPGPRPIPSVFEGDPNPQPSIQLEEYKLSGISGYNLTGSNNLSLSQSFLQDDQSIFRNVSKFENASPLISE